MAYLVLPREHVALPDLKKHMAKLRTLLGGNCILYDDGYTRYGISRLILTALYHRWTYISGKEISEKIGVSRMTVNRALLEIL